MPSTGFDSQSWYKHLFEYGLSEDPSTSGNGSDPDEELIPRLVTQLVLPLAAHSLQHAWRPHSRRSTAAAKAMLEDLLIYVPPEEAKLQARLSSCHVAVHADRELVAVNQPHPRSLPLSAITFDWDVSHTLFGCHEQQLRQHSSHMYHTTNK